ncbi:MAG: HNH endonuclease [Ottowia sp.]|nr:HNH endonuclease [Ottowia sp.]
MTINENSTYDPAKMDIEKIQPKPGLATNFEQAAYPTLTFSTKSRIWGDQSGNALESSDLDNELRQKTLTKNGYRCMFCGFYSQRNHVHNLTDNHRDIQPDNLQVADPLCHGWQHLGELGEGNAVLAYLPGISGQDVNHLQRTIMIALQSDDASIRDDGKKLLNWLASHRDYIKEAWGSYEPGVFVEALTRFHEEHREKREVVFHSMSVVFNPGLYSQYVTTWSRESYAAFPIAKWGEVYHNVMNAPA